MHYETTKIPLKEKKKIKPNVKGLFDIFTMFF